MLETSPEVKGFFLHLSQCDALFNLPPESAVNALKMCRDYCMGKEPTCDDPVAVCAFGLMRPSLDKSMRRAENGRKGGEAKAGNAKQTLANASKAKQTLANDGKAKQTLAKEQRTKNKEQEQREEKEIPANPRFAGFVREFQNAIAAKHGATAPKVTDSLIAAGCQAMEQAERIDGFSWDEIQDALLWAMDDDFWGNNVLSLAQVRKRGANDTSKLQKVMAAYQKHKATDARPFWDRPGVL